MAAEGFKVDLEALKTASSGITDTLVKLKVKKVSDIDSKKSDVGHSHLADVLENFCTRWEIGVENLAKDAQAISARLDASVKAYQGVEATIVDGMLGSSSGEDPGAK
ncbi:hypothetical protein ABZW03_04350 [Kitasatospora sp. NPDC004799]|uniref:hypothetical protein n=1 Tax=Kitasatospora sp. NPDC004799 TaxID=3154460 RepID=UPI0033AE12F7